MLNPSEMESRWIESNASDFQPVFAAWFDHPVPSGVSMAEFGLTRVALLTGKEVHFKEYLQPFQSDFYNITAMISNGLFHVITSPEPVSWKQTAGKFHQGQRCHYCRIVSGEHALFHPLFHPEL